MLNVTEEYTRKVHADSDHFMCLKIALDNLDNVLRDVSTLKSHFDAVGPPTRITWERMGWAEVELSDIRSKLSVHIGVLNMLNTHMIRYELSGMYPTSSW